MCVKRNKLHSPNISTLCIKNLIQDLLCNDDMTLQAKYYVSPNDSQRHPFMSSSVKLDFCILLAQPNVKHQVCKICLEAPPTRLLDQAQPKLGQSGLAGLSGLVGLRREVLLEEASTSLIGLNLLCK